MPSCFYKFILDKVDSEDHRLAFHVSLNSLPCCPVFLWDLNPWCSWHSWSDREDDFRVFQKYFLFTFIYVFAFSLLSTLSLLYLCFGHITYWPAPVVEYGPSWFFWLILLTALDMLLAELERILEHTKCNLSLWLECWLKMPKG